MFLRAMDGAQTYNNWLEIAFRLTYLSLRRARHRDYKGAHVPERANFSWRAEAEPYSLWASAGWGLADVIPLRLFS